MTIVKVPALTVSLVTLASGLYIAKRVEEVYRTTQDRIMDRRIKEIRSLHHRATEEVRADFELWWMTEFRQKAREALLAEAPTEYPGVDDEFQDEFQDQLIERSLQNVHGVALHLAAHAHMGNREERLFARLPRSAREDAQAARAEHEQALVQDRLVFTTMGLDIKEFERFFSPS